MTGVTAPIVGTTSLKNLEDIIGMLQSGFGNKELTEEYQEEYMFRCQQKKRNTWRKHICHKELSDMRRIVVVEKIM